MATKARMTFASGLRVTVNRVATSKSGYVRVHPDDLEHAKQVFRPGAFDNIAETGEGSDFLTTFRSFALARLLTGRGVEATTTDLVEPSPAHLLEKAKMVRDQIRSNHEMLTARAVETSRGSADE